MLVSVCKMCGGEVAYVDRRWLHDNPPKDGSHVPVVDWDSVRRVGGKPSLGRDTTDDSNYLEQF